MSTNKDLKTKEPHKNFYTIGEEIFNAVTHGVGGLIAIAATVILIVKAALNGTAISVVSAAIFGSSMILLYAISTLYHSLVPKTAKAVFRILDHCMIFVLISGTYTPYVLISLNGALGWTIFGILWGITILGIVLNSINLEKFKKFSMICYILMGWCIIFAIKPIVATVDFGGILLLFLGGVFYTGGVLFYRKKSVKYMHSIWHLFVLAGSIMHFFSILFFVIP